MVEILHQNSDRPTDREIIDICQFLASTLDLDTLLERLIQILLRYSGCDSGAIVLPDKDDRWQIRAIANSTWPTTHFIDLPLKYTTELPLKAIEYAIANREILNIDRLVTDLPIIDRYLEQVNPQSLLCFPLINDRNLTGIIYLQHQTNPAVFTPDRLSLLTDIGRQAAISLTNIWVHTNTLARSRSTDLAFQFNRRMAADLAQTKQKYLNLIQSIDGVVWEYDLATDKFIFVSDRAVELLGYPLAIWRDRPHFWYACLHPDDRERAIAKFDAAIQNRHHCELEYRMVAADGHIVWVYDVSTIVFDGNGRAIATTGLILDITERKSIELALQESRHRYQSLVDNIPCIIYQCQITADGSLSFLYISSFCQILLDLNPDTIVAQPETLLRTIHPEDISSFNSFIEMAATATHAVHWQGRFLHPNGSTKWIRTEAFPLPQADGSIVWDGISIDTTEQRIAEIALHQANRDLYRASQIKSEFIAAISHELRTPLNAILGMSANLQGNAPAPNQIQPLATLERNGQKLLSLINSLIDFSQLETGTIELNRTSISISHLARTSLQAIDTKADLKGIELAFSLPPHLPQILADERLMYRVLIEILDNAIKFTPAGGRVSLSAKLQPDSSVCISIADTGIGIAEIDRQRLFQPFTQLDSSLDRHYSGTGLGLALADRIVKLHDGTISVQPTTTNKTNPGSYFTITLPPSRTIANSGSESYHHESDLSPASPPLKILIVKEDRAKLDSIASYLGAKGYTVATAHRNTAIPRAIEFQPDTICIDFDRSTITNLRHQATLSHTAIVALLPKDTERESALAAGATECAIEPLRLQQLLAIIISLGDRN